MTTQEQAYIEGFVKRASEYGFNQNEAVELLKYAQPAPFSEVQYSPGGRGNRGTYRVGGAIVPASEVQTTSTWYGAPRFTYTGQGGGVADYHQGSRGSGGAYNVGKNLVPNSSVRNINGTPIYSPLAGQQALTSPTQNKPAPAAPQSATMGGAASPVAGGNMGGMSGGIGGGFGQIAHNPAQAASVPVTPATPATSNTALLNAKVPANTFGGDVQLGLSGRTSPAPLGPPAPAAASAAQGGPSNAYLAKIMGSYNPNSALDQRKANAIRQVYQPGMSANQIYANKGYQAASQRR